MTHQPSRTIILVAVLLATLIVMPFPASTQEPIKIGALFPLTGDEGAFGSDSLAAVQIAADIFNKKGGVKGRMVEIVPADVTTPEQAASEASRLITQQHINVLIGTTLSLLGIPASATADRLGALYWDATDASTQITDRGLKHVFQFSPHADAQGLIEADFAAKVIAPALHKSPSQLRVGVTYTNDAFGSQVGRAAAAQAKKSGLNVLVEESYDPKITDLSPLILKLKGQNVDVVLQSTFQPDAILFNKQLRQLDFNPVVIGALGYDNPATVQALGDCINGVFNSSAPQFSAIDPKKLSPEGRESYLAYGPAYKAKTGRTTSIDSDEAFAAAWTLFFHVLAPVGDDKDVEALAKQARTLSLPVGSLANGYGVKFDDHQYNTASVQAVTQYQNQKPVTVYPPSLTTVPVAQVPRPAWSSICK